MGDKGKTMVELKLITTRLDHGLPIEDGSINSTMVDTVDDVVEDDDWVKV